MSSAVAASVASAACAVWVASGALVAGPACP